MAAKTLQLELVTPEKIELAASADFVVLPAHEGEMGILPGHMPFLVELKPGEVRVTAGDKASSFFVTGGFAEIKDDRVTLLAETAEQSQAIDAERARQELEKAKAERLRKDLDPVALAAAEAAMRRASLKLRVSLGRKGGGGPAPLGR